MPHSVWNNNTILSVSHTTFSLNFPFKILDIGNHFLGYLALAVNRVCCSLMDLCRASLRSLSFDESPYKLVGSLLTTCISFRACGNVALRRLCEHYSVVRSDHLTTGGVRCCISSTTFANRPLLHVCRLIERRAHRKEFRRKECGI